LKNISSSIIPFFQLIYLLRIWKKKKNGFYLSNWKFDFIRIL